MAAVNIYLTFNGNCEEAFNFYKSVLGGEFSFVGRFKDMPADPNHPPVPDSEKDKIMHISLPVSKETVLMGCDSSEAFGRATIGTNFTISVNTPSEEEARKIFNGLAAGGKVTMPLDKTFWAPLFGMLTDKFGIQWMVSLEHK